MEHIVQFAISMDDEAIKRAVEKNAEKEITENIRKDIEANLFRSNYYGKPDKGALAYWVEQKVDALLAENKDIILERAAEKLADKLAKSKAGKALLTDIAPQ